MIWQGKLEKKSWTAYNWHSSQTSRTYLSHFIPLVYYSRTLHNFVSVMCLLNMPVNGVSGWLSGLNIQLLVLAQVRISEFGGSNSASGSMLSTESAGDSFASSPSASPHPACTLSTNN